MLRIPLSLTLLCLLAGYGCTRTDYRMAADREAYCLINSRQKNPLWDLPSRPVEPASTSRMYLQTERDCGPKPLDDASAKELMNFPYCIDNTKYYGKIATRPDFENPTWLDHLPRTDDGSVQLTPELSNQLALIHSRDFQTQYEQVYLSALQLTGNRFEFDTQWQGGFGGLFTATGSDLGDQRNLNVTLNRLGFSRNLAGGGQLATNLVNSLFWDFSAGGTQVGSASLVTTFTQPILRGAFRHVRLENLTQAERNLLYGVRDFARFRRGFFLTVTSSYYNLLGQKQAIRNAEINVENLRQNLAEYDYYVSLNEVTPVQRDQVFQQYQNGRLSVLASQQGYAGSLDQFKFLLGLPAWVPLNIDETLLKQFDLVNPKLDSLQDDAQTLFIDLMQFLPPDEIADQRFLEDKIEEFGQMREVVASLVPEIEAELSDWTQRLDSVDKSTLSQDDLLDFEQQESLAERVADNLKEVRDALDSRQQFKLQLLADVKRLFKEHASDSDPPAALEIGESEPIDPRIIAWNRVQSAVDIELKAAIVELYLLQTQIRLYLIEIDPLPKIESQTAVSYAFQNRLDLKNSQAFVMDAFRRVEVAADGLESDLSIQGSVTVGSDPTQNSPFRFDSSGNRYTVGAQFDGPLNRLNERNVYRAAQIAYQQSTRQFIANRDSVANEVRDVLRQLELSRLNFQIARQQVVAATRQVDEAQLNLRSPQGGQSESVTLFLLQGLQGILDAKNNLVSNWISYRIQKIRLFVALEMLYLNESGQWLNEDEDLRNLAERVFADPTYFPPADFATSDETGRIVGRTRTSPTDMNQAFSSEPNGLEEKPIGPTREELPVPVPGPAAPPSLP